MAKDATAPKKDRKPARTIEERIEELRVLAEARAVKAATKAKAKVEELNTKILVAEAKLSDLYAELSEAQVLLGEDTDEAEAAVETYTGEPVN